jgi:hypothetical protein
VCLDDQGHEIGEGLGQTKNITADGILVESITPIDAEFVSLMIVDFKSELRQIKGKVARSQNSGSGLHETHIQFMGSKEEILKNLKLIVQTYHYQKK